MFNLLVDTPSGEQAVIEVTQTGGYFDALRVLWDEREDGPLPEITLGGMARQGGSLVFDSSRLAQHNAIAASSRLNEVKAEAKCRIIAFFPGATLNNYRDKEINLISRIAELNDKRMARLENSINPALTAGEETELTNARSLWSTVKAIRAASNRIEQDILASSDPTNFDVVNSPRWP